MGCWKIWQQSEKKLPSADSATLRELFQILSTTFLSLLVPLSFLLLARLSSAHYLLSSTDTTSGSSSPLFLYTYPSLLALVSLVSVAAFIHRSPGRNRATLVREVPNPVPRPHLYISWIFLGTLHICVSLGIDGTIAVGIDGSGFGHEKSLLSRIVFFLGLHETMLYWLRTIVKPVVDDTVFGSAKDERWVERVTVAVSFGCLWWWRLRDEVESLVVVAEVKRQLRMGVGAADIFGWWLYYLTVMIGMVRVVEGLIWVGKKLPFRGVEGKPPPNAMAEKV